MSPLSSDPEARARQLANLRRGETKPSPTANLRHGGYAAIARRDLDEKRAEVREALTLDAPLRDPDGGLPAPDALAVSMLAEVLCRRDNVREYLDRRGWEGDDGQPRPAVDLERRLRSEALDLMRELGMTPKARAALGLDLIRSVSAAESAAEAARVARERLDRRAADIDLDATTETDAEA